MAEVISTGSAPVAAVPSPIHTWEPNFQTREEALAAIAEWAPSITDDEPSIEAYNGLKWNVRWLSRAVLICKDARSLLRLKTYATVFDGVTKIEDVLELGIRFGVSFELYIPVEQARGSPKASFPRSQKLLLQRYTLPDTWIRRLLGMSQVQRTGDSVQPWSFDRAPPWKGWILHPSADTTLWPPPDVLESESAHFTGYLSQGAYTLLEDLRSKILDEHKYEWRTRAQWKTYLVKGSKGEHKPAYVPSKKDFAKGKGLFERSFSENWDKEDIADLEFPMKFLPLIRQD
ncbi:hypothetical protein B0H13DRAFT_1926920 [Mycena leptocephala]|nr:hypothetical protein B0H13DRAFT_1926920 [Mycena leptocephala]